MGRLKKSQDYRQIIMTCFKFHSGSNIPVKIHNDKSVLKIVIKQMEGKENGNSSHSQPELKQSQVKKE